MPHRRSGRPGRWRRMEAPDDRNLQIVGVCACPETSPASPAAAILQTLPRVRLASPGARLSGIRGEGGLNPLEQPLAHCFS